MISLLLLVLYSIINFIINLLPTGGTWPTEVHSAFTTLGGYVGLMDAFIPVSIMLWCLTTLFGIEMIIFAYKTLNWILSHIPWFGGASIKD